ncbi:MAG: nucleotidyltransferase domain-containing protein [Pseudomonadota bacterium]
MISAAVPEALLNSVIAYFNPRRVILFGSAARGAAGPDSDYDLVVVLDDDVPPERLSWRASYEARRDWHRAVDILQCRETTFRERSRIVGSLAHSVATEGVIVYERT